MRTTLLWGLGAVGVIAAVLATCGPLQSQDATRRSAALAAPPPLSTTFTMGGAQYENTSRVIPPGVNASCPNGRVFVQTGQGFRGILSRPLFDGPNIHIDVSSPPASFDLTQAGVQFPSTEIATDNQIVRLKDGSLLTARPAFVLSPLNPATYPYANTPIYRTTDPGLNTTPTTSPVNGLRGGLEVFKSTDCGTTWSSSLLDYATFNSGKFGYPRQYTRPDGKMLYVSDGPDRPEVYVCPYTGNIYATFRVTSGPFMTYPTVRETALVMSTPSEGGTTWHLLAELTATEPIVMTSTPSGRLFLLDAATGVPTIRFSTQPFVAGQLGTFNGPYTAQSSTNGTPDPIATAKPPGGPLGFRITLDQDTTSRLAMYAGAATEGSRVSINLDCSATTTDPKCFWRFQNGMIISAFNPHMALTTTGGGVTPAVTLTSTCTPSNPNCTWTYQQGQFASDQNPGRKIDASGASDGNQLFLNSACSSTRLSCVWTLPKVMLSNGANHVLHLNAAPTASQGLALTVGSGCSTGNTDCLWRMTKGMILSETNNGLAMNAFGGASQGNPIKLFSVVAGGCSTANPDCTWSWSKSGLLSDDTARGTFGINVSGSVVSGAPLIVDSACATTSPATCLYTGLGAPFDTVDISSAIFFAPSISRVSRYTTTNVVRFVYPTMNTLGTEEARVVQFDSDNPTAPFSVTAIAADQAADHHVMYPTFIDPDGIEQSTAYDPFNTAMLYWYEVPSPTAVSHDYSAKYVMITDLTVTGKADLDLASSWLTEPGQGDYVGAGFFWRNKTFNYVPQWVQQSNIKGNVVTVPSANRGFVIQSDGNPNLLVTAPDGIADGSALKLSASCGVWNPACTWSYVNGMLLNDQNPTLAINAWGGATELTALRLSANCSASNADCTWTYKNGAFYSDNTANRPSLAINAYGGTVAGNSLVLTGNCVGLPASCTWTLPNVVLTTPGNRNLGVNAYGGAHALNPVKLVAGCALTNTDCTWTFSHGQILADSNHSFTINAYGGAANGNSLVIAPICTAPGQGGCCTQTNTDCTWNWKHGQIFSDSAGGSSFPVLATSGAISGSALTMNNAVCTPTNPNCQWEGLYGR